MIGYYMSYITHLDQRAILAIVTTSALCPLVSGSVSFHS
jgi:hypothetical protein